MLWFYTALLSGLLLAATAIIGKEVMQETSASVFTSLFVTLSALFYLPVFLYYFTPEYTQLIAALAPFILLSGTANILGMMGVNKAIKETDISIALPLNRLQPVFVAVIGALVLNERITLSLGTGIILVTLGSYIVLLKDRHHYLEPVTSLRKDTGAQIAIASAAIFAIAAVTDRYVTQSLDPRIYTFFILLIMATTINTYLQKRNGNHLNTMRTEFSHRKPLYLLAGLFGAGAYLSIIMSLSLAEASKVIPILQVQIPLTILAGGQFFGETHILQKLLGSLILITGIILVAL